MDFDLAPMMTGPPISRVVIGFLRNVVEPVACLDVEILAVDVKQRPVGMDQRRDGLQVVRLGVEQFMQVEVGRQLDGIESWGRDPPQDPVAIHLDVGKRAQTWRDDDRPRPQRRTKSCRHIPRPPCRRSESPKAQAGDQVRPPRVAPPQAGALSTAVTPAAPAVPGADVPAWAMSLPAVPVGACDCGQCGLLYQDWSL